METRHPLILPHLPMKDMDGAMLSLALLDELRVLDWKELLYIRSAMSLAAYLHRVDTRKGPTQASSGKRHQPSSPYIEHPLRDTLRLARWGVEDVAILIASLLHDTVEDHAKDIAAEFTFSPVEILATEESSRFVACKYISKTFGQDVELIVRAVSNPILDDDNLTRDERNALYVQHVASVIDGDVRVFLVKVSDFVDNALGLHHFTNGNTAKVKAQKYLPLVPLFLDAWDRVHPQQSLSVSGAADLKARLDSAQEYLEDLIGV